MITQADFFVTGFMAKCAEAGVNPVQVALLHGEKQLAALCQKQAGWNPFTWGQTGGSGPATLEQDARYVSPNGTGQKIPKGTVPSAQQTREMAHANKQQGASQYPPVQTAGAGNQGLPGTAGRLGG